MFMKWKYYFIINICDYLSNVIIKIVINNHMIYCVHVQEEKCYVITSEFCLQKMYNLQRKSLVASLLYKGILKKL